MRGDTPVQYVKGVGPKTAQRFERLGVFTLEELLCHYPRRYVDYTQPSPVAQAPYDTDTVVKATVMTKKGAVRLPGGRVMVQVMAADDTAALSLTWFNTQFAADKLLVGQEYYFEGRVKGTLTRRETTLEEVLRMVAEDYWGRQTDRAAQGGYEGSWELLYAAAADSVLEDGEELPLLQEGLLARKTRADRVVWFTTQVTIPAGESVQVEAAYTKAASLNSGPPDMADKNLCGYELLPYAGSNLTFIGQTALVVGEEAVPGWYGSLSFGETVLTGERYALYTYQ